MPESIAEQPATRRSVGVSAPVRVRHETDDGRRFVVVEASYGVTLDRVTAAMVTLDPSARLVSVVGGLSGSLKFELPTADRTGR